MGESVLERHRLTAALRAGAARGIVVVSAPVGFGATTAVAQALVPDTTTAWVSLDALDADPLALARQVAHLVSTRAGHDTAAVGDHPLEVISWVADVVADTGITCLVLDGLDARHHREALEVVGYLCESLPPSVGLVITTHDDVSTLPVPLLSGRLTVVTADDLRLRPDEAATLVVETCPDLTADVVEGMAQAADGWTAALREAALQAAHHPGTDPVAWLQTEGCDRITSAALATTTPIGADFLVATALLDELSAPLCDAVLGRHDSAEVLLGLYAFGSLISPVSKDASAHAGRIWERPSLLTLGLRRRAFGEDLSDRHGRAAAWYRAAGVLDQTMNHLVASGDFAAAGEYLSLHEDALYESGDASRAAAWYSSLPPETWGRRGWHLLRTSWGRALTGDVRGAEVTLEQLRSHLASSPALHPEEATLHGEAALISAYLAGMRGDADLAVREAARAADLADDSTPVNSTQLAPLLLVRSLLWRGDVESARRQLARTDHMVFPTDLLREAALGAQRAHCLIAEGYITAGRQVARRASEWLASQNLDAVEVAQFALTTAIAAGALENGDPLDADARLGATAEQARERAYVGDAIDALRWQSRARVALGDLVGGLASVGQARGLMLESAPGSSVARTLDLQEAWIRHLAGDNVRAERLVQSLPPGDQRTLMWARLTMDRQGSRALSALAEVSSTLPRHQATKQVLLARAAMKRSHRLAETHLLQAADIARDHGLALVFLGAQRDLLDLAVSVGSRTGHDDLVSLASSARELYRRAPVERVAASGASTAYAALSPGEIHLLAFLPTRDTNEDIARHLGVSVNTVKTRLRRLYRKLDASGRDDALDIARSRGLIS